MNDSGEIVGMAYGEKSDEGRTSNSFLWSATEGWVNLDKPKKTGEGISRDFGLVDGINDQGEMIGIGKMGLGGDNAPYIWSASEGFKNLKGFAIEGTGWAADLNDHGQIVGVGMHDGESRAFLLTPIQESAVDGVQQPPNPQPLTQRGK